MDDNATEREELAAPRAWEWWAEKTVDGTLPRFFKWQAKRLKLDEVGQATLMSECASKLPAIVARWREDGGASLTSHCFNCLKWYVHKLVANGSGGQLGIAHSAPQTGKRRRSLDVDEPGVQARLTYKSAGSTLAELDEWISDAVGRMSFQRAAIARLSVQFNLPDSEIARCMGWSRRRAELLARAARRELAETLLADDSRREADEVIAYILKETA